MITYTKIENIYERDNDTKKLIEGKFNDPSVEYLANAEWYGTEKIDGTNIGVAWDGYRVSFQGRTEKSEIPKHLLAELEKLFGGQENEEFFEKAFGERQVILFGEGFGYKIQGDAGAAYLGDKCGFILFDVYSVDNGTWLPRSAIEQIAALFKIMCVPVVFTGTLDEAVKFVKTHPDSTIGSAKMEGIVCKPLLDLQTRDNKRLIVKIKARDW